MFHAGKGLNYHIMNSPIAAGIEKLFNWPIITAGYYWSAKYQCSCKQGAAIMFFRVIFSFHQPDKSDWTKQFSENWPTWPELSMAQLQTMTIKLNIFAVKIIIGVSLSFPGSSFISLLFTIPYPSQLVIRFLGHKVDMSIQKLGGGEVISIKGLSIII